MYERIYISEQDNAVIEYCTRLHDEIILVAAGMIQALDSVEAPFRTGRPARQATIQKFQTYVCDTEPHGYQQLSS